MEISRPKMYFRRLARLRGCSDCFLVICSVFIFCMPSRVILCVICDNRESTLGRESSRKKGITNNGLRKQFQTSHNIFFFTHLMRRWRFLFEANRRIKSLKRKKVRKSHLLFCLQQRCLLASVDQKTKTRGLTIVLVISRHRAVCLHSIFFFSFLFFC